jgi:hypothetical protein
MKKIALTVIALALLVVAYEGAAIGAGSSTATEGGQIQFRAADRCALIFGFRGFAPGTQVHLQVRINGATHAISFTAPSPAGIWGYWLHPYLGHRHDLVNVDYRITAQGMSKVLSGSTMVSCDCGEEEGGGGHEGGGGNEGGGGSTPSAGSATPVSSQPGFAG